MSTNPICVWLDWRAKRFQCGGFHALGDDGKSREDVGELGFCQVVKVGDEAV